VRKDVIAALLVAGAAALASPPSRAEQARGARKVETERADRYQVPAGTALLLKLKTPLDSGKASLDDQVEATLWSPVVQDGIELIPVGSVAIGKVVDVKRATERTPSGSVAFAFSIVEHAETGSRAMMTTRKVLVEAPPVQDDAGRGKSKPKPKAVQATMPEGAPFIARTAEPLIVRIPR
jgi:hypothetical protein